MKGTPYSLKEVLNLDDDLNPVKKEKEQHFNYFNYFIMAVNSN